MDIDIELSEESQTQDVVELGAAVTTSSSQSESIPRKSWSSTAMAQIKSKWKLRARKLKKKLIESQQKLRRWAALAAERRLKRKLTSQQKRARAKSRSKKPRNQAPSDSPRATPSNAPTPGPTEAPTNVPSHSSKQNMNNSKQIWGGWRKVGHPWQRHFRHLLPTAAPSDTPSAPSNAPTPGPTEAPTHVPSQLPTAAPSDAPSAPSNASTPGPTEAPTHSSTDAPSANPNPSAPMGDGRQARCSDMEGMLKCSKVSPFGRSENERYWNEYKNCPDSLAKGSYFYQNDNYMGCMRFSSRYALTRSVFSTTEEPHLKAMGLAKGWHVSGRPAVWKVNQASSNVGAFGFKRIVCEPLPTDGSQQACHVFKIAYCIKCPHFQFKHRDNGYATTWAEHVQPSGPGSVEDFAERCIDLKSEYDHKLHKWSYMSRAFTPSGEVKKGYRCEGKDLDRFQIEMRLM